MNFEEILERELNESDKIEYKDKRADNTSIVKDLVALANDDGGKLLYGVQESSGAIEEIQNIDNYSQFEESISQTISSQVDPVLPIEVRKVEHNESVVVGMSVDHQGLLHTFDTGNNKPCIPMRVGSTTDYLGGATLREFYRSRFESVDSGLAGWLDEMRKQAHRITYNYEENDFVEISKREMFADCVNEVARELETRLEKPHRDVDDTTARLMNDFVNSCEELLSSGITATKPPVQSRRGGIITGGGHVSDYSENEFRNKAKEVDEKATRLQKHIKKQY
ncbi:AlbA family DNA-binding domain-containing protein [Halococcus sp. AFM35]|uniref:AlbA family DNA-binding domain-containing protein n=1 Tax=Halococcus sp. AFM35 TaxID=3421653 RepID=UPI003EBFC345